MVKTHLERTSTLSYLENSADLKKIVSLGLDTFSLGLSWSWKPALSEQKHLKQSYTLMIHFRKCVSHRWSAGSGHLPVLLLVFGLGFLGHCWGSLRFTGACGDNWMSRLGVQRPSVLYVLRLREYTRGSLTSHPVPLTGAALRAGCARTGRTPTAGSLESWLHGNPQVWVTVAMVGHKEDVEFIISIGEDLLLAVKGVNIIYVNKLVKSAWDVYTWLGSDVLRFLVPVHLAHSLENFFSPAQGIWKWSFGAPEAC